MKAMEAMAVARLRQWSALRMLLHCGRAAQLRQSGWIERRARNFDARQVQVIDFEKAFATLPEAEQTLLLLVYRDRERIADTAAALGTSPRTALYHLPVARQHLAEALDRRDLL